MRSERMMMLGWGCFWILNWKDDFSEPQTARKYTPVN